MTKLADLKRDYRTSFIRYLVRQEEAPLHTGYILGRTAVAEGMSILDLAEMHHDVLIEVLEDTPAGDLNRVATRASEFFVEVLSTYDMTQRGFMAGP
jgi:hypothetical protein